jgi:hypothetical protein
MWLMILLAVHTNNPQDIPGKVTLEFPTEEACRHSLKSMTFWLKFDSFKVIGKCEKK